MQRIAADVELYIGNHRDYELQREGADFDIVGASKTFHAEACGYKNGRAAPPGPEYLYALRTNGHGSMRLIHRGLLPPTT